MLPLLRPCRPAGCCRGDSPVDFNDTLFCMWDGSGGSDATGDPAVKRGVVAARPPVSAGGEEWRCLVYPAIWPVAHPLRGRSRRGRALCGTRTRGWRSQRAPRTRPAKIGEVRAVRRSRVRGARGRSSASAVPSQRRPFVSRKPPKRRLRPRAASRETSEVDAKVLHT
jgi:hypothetical protein